MIYDSVQHIDRYKGLYPYLDKAIDYIQSHDLKDLPAGKHEIETDKLYMNAVATSTKAEDAGVFELHRQYLDLHLDLSGSEIVQYADYPAVDETVDYHAEGDYALMQCSTTAQCVVDETHFTVCMLNEPHKPCVQTGDACEIKKVIFKIWVG